RQPVSTSALKLSGYVSVWIQKCLPADVRDATQRQAGATERGIPQALHKNRPVELEIPLPFEEESAVYKVKEEKFKIGGGEFSIKMKFYAIYPSDTEAKDLLFQKKALSKANSGKTAPKIHERIYFQIQIETGGDFTGAFCAASMNYQDFFPFPVVMCARNFSKDSRIGVTLHRDKL
ncbi:MAG: hypothetical protein HY746_09015, partial [Elusimicrobia bacterium]|nr:hypothetical protein [Elusimicrobiota bacterium]